MLSSESRFTSLPEMSSDEALPPINRWTMICGLSFVGIVGIALTLAAIIQYPVKITANGAVRPVGELRVAQASAEATVKSINVKENQPIRQGDVIATLDDAQLQIKKSQLIGTIQSNQGQLERVDDQLSALGTQRIAEAHVMNRTIASAQADLVRTQREHRDRQITTQTEVAEAQADLDLAQKSYWRYQQLANQGAISRQQRDEKEQVFKVARAKLERATTSLNPSDALVTVANESIAKERAKGESTLAVLDKEGKTLLQRRIELQNQLNRDRKDLKQIETDISKYIIRAPETGTLFKLDLRNVGQIVRPVDAIAQIAPSNAPLVVKAQINTQDRSRIALNQKVYLRVNAYPYPDYGVLTGEVVAISPDAIQLPTSSLPDQQSKLKSGTVYYEVTIQPKTLYLKNDSKNVIQPGMEVTAEIIAKEETILRFLLRKARLITDL